MIKPDAISYFFDILAVSVLLFFTTFGGSLFQGSVVAALLLLSGVALDPLANKGGEEEEADNDESSYNRIGIATVSAVAVFYTLSYFVPIVPPQYLPNLSIVKPLSITSVGGLFVIQIAVGESEFFHRLLTNFAVSRLGSASIGFVGFPFVGGVGTVYHFAVYGDSPANLVIVFGAFTALAFVAWSTQRVSPVILAHVINNFIASGGLSSSFFPHSVMGITLANLAFGGLAFAMLFAVRHQGRVRAPC